MSAIAANDYERRVYPRIAINGTVRYKLENEDAFSDGIMINISQTGVLVSLERELAVDTQLTLLMESDSADQPPIEITAEIIRIAEPATEHGYSYGCTILDVRDL